MGATELQRVSVGDMLVWASKAGHVPVEYRGRHDIGGVVGAVIITRSPDEMPAQVAVYAEELMTTEQSIIATLGSVSVWRFVKKSGHSTEKQAHHADDDQHHPDDADAPLASSVQPATDEKQTADEEGQKSVVRVGH